MDDKRGKDQVVHVDLNKEFEESAEAVVRVCFPTRPVRPEHIAGLTQVVSELFDQAWVGTEPRLRAIGFDSDRIKSIRGAFALAAWNQVVWDLGCSVRIVAEGEK